MNCPIFFASRTGNTKLLAQTLADALSKENPTQLINADACQKLPEFPEDTTYFIGFWTDKGDCSPAIQAVLQSLKNRKVFLFGTAGFGQSQDYFNKILTNVSSHLPAGNTVIGSFMCQGKMPENVRARYEKMLEAKPEDPMIQSFIQNFDAALSHPDQTDQDRLIQAMMDSLHSIR